MIANPFLIIIFAANAVLAVLILIRDPRSRANQFYGLFVVALDFWILANFFENEPGIVGYERLALFLRFDFALGVIILYGWLRFSMAFTGNAALLAASWKRWVILIVGAVLVYFSFVTDFIIGHITFSEGIIHFQTGWMWPVYAAYLVYTASAGVWFLAVHWRNTKGNPYERSNLNLIFLGFFLSIGIAIFINLFLQPFVPVSLALSRLGLYGMSFLVISTAYAVIRGSFLSVKVITVEAFIVMMILIFGVNFLGRDYPHVQIVNGIMFAGILLLGMLVIRGIHRSEAQREELEDVTAQLGRANAGLAELSRFKTQLLSLASHQIKSPLSIMKGYLTLLLDNAFGPVDGKVRDTLEKSKKAADDLTVLIEDLLSLRRVEEGKMDYQFAKTDFGALVTEVTENFAPLAIRKGLKFKVEKPPQPLFVNADGAKLKEVIRNLIDNALKYTPTGSISVIAGGDGRYVRLSVQDTGLGMPAELVPRLFDEFVRDERIRHEIQGSGFGLYIARKIVEAHGGTITASSAGPGEGSMFTMSLPTMK